MKLEDDLRRAFERRPAPAEFENRVFARIQRETLPALRAPSGVRRRTLKWLAAAATIVAAAGGARLYEHRHNVAEARRIESEIGLAMHLTSEALARVQVKLQQTTN
jgi:hypothetical protein